MEMTHQGGAEAESLLRPDQRGAVVMPGQKRWEGDGEKAPFLRNEPVKLTPAWEGANLPNDTLNLKGIVMDLVPPRDRWNLVYLTLMLHGLGTLTSWNMLITAKSYFMDFKLDKAPEYKQNFLTSVGWACQIPNLLFSWINVFVQIKGNLTTRIVWSLIIEVVLFVITVILAMVDTSDYPALFFWLTMVTAFLLNGFNSIFQNSVFGVAARLPAKYTGAVVLGSNICGTLVVFLSMTAELASSPRTAAIYYFICGMFVLLVCLDTYFALPLNRFYRYHETLQARTHRNNPALAATDHQPEAKRAPYGTILAQSAVQLYNVFIIFFVSLAVFPAVQAAIQQVDPKFLGLSEDKVKAQKLFELICCYLTFNFTAMLGNITASLWQFPSPRWLVVFTTLRLFFIPFFLLCNYQLDAGNNHWLTRTMPVLVNNDWAYWVGGALLGWSSGHGSSLAMMYVGGTVAPEHAPTAGMIGGATLVTGIVAGITFSRLCPTLITTQLWSAM